MTPVVVGLGSNIAPHFQLGQVLKALASRYTRLRISPIYLAQAYGFNGPHFWNLVAAFETDQPLQPLLQHLRALEIQAGRPQPAPKWVNRCVDIDVLLYGDCLGRIANVQLPRPDILNFAFVLKPLSDLLPEACHPQLKRTYAQLWQHFERTQPAKASQIQALPSVAYADFYPLVGEG